MDPINLFQRAINQTGRIVAGVRPDQMAAGTPCTDWNVRALLNHTIGAVGMFDAAAHGTAFDPTRFEQEYVGADPGASYEVAAKALRATLSAPAVADAMWTMPFGTVPGAIGLAFATLEMHQHGWDVARATGQDVAFDPEITEAAFATARMAPAEQVRVQGVFGPEVGCSSGAPAHDQLAAFLGRTV